MSKDKTKSRRAFLTLGLSESGSKIKSTEQSGNEKVKMLTSDGQLVEVDKAVFENLRIKKKTTNKEILDWRDKNLNKST